VNLALQNPELKILDQFRDRYIFKAYGFSKGCTADPPVGKMVCPDEATQTAIGTAMETVLRELHGQPVAAMVIVTDGRSNEGTDPVNVAEQMADRGVKIPVYTVGVGNPLPPKDIVLSRLEAPDVAVAGDFVEFKFTVTSKGFQGEIIQAAMTEHDQQIAPLQDIKLEGGEREVDQQVLMRWKPEKPGEYEIRIATPVRSEELVETNNELKHRIRVIDNKIQVLYVEGYPRWEYRYLKNALVRDKTMIVDVFLASADQTYPQEGTPGRPPLESFPGDKARLGQYDVIILGDIEPRILATETLTENEAIENLVYFVEELGGGLVCIAGEAWAPRVFGDTPLARILPVSIDRSSSTMGIVHDEPVRPELTPMGKESPLMRLNPAGSPEDNVELWTDADGKGDGLAGFFWFYKARSPKAGAQVLATHPTYDVENGQKLPVFAMQRVGRGLCFFSAVDCTWRWRFVRGDQYFYTFWGQVIRHMRGGRLVGSKRFYLELDKTEYDLMDRVGIRARVLDREFEPVIDTTYPVALNPEGEIAQDIELKAVENPESDPKKKGWFEGEFRPARKGAYEVTLGPRGLDDTDAKAYERFVVGEPNLEYDNPTMDTQTLLKVSEVTKGKFLPLYEVDRLLSTIKETGAIVDIETKEQDLWDTPLVYILFALLITVEWVIRKLVRLL
jgi:uncharacterized membrane protein